MFEKYDIPETDEMYFEKDKLVVPVVAQSYSEDYQGSSRGEEYFEEELVSTETVSVECQLEFVYNDSDPDEEYSGQKAVEFLNSKEIESVEIKDPETVEIIINSELYICSYDSSELDNYK